MKKIVTLLLAAGLMLGGTTAAHAVDIAMSGQFDFTAQWANARLDKVGGIKGYNTKGQNNAFYQRLITQIDIVASEALSGVVTLEIGDTIWGNSDGGTGKNSGGGLGADGVSIAVKNAYLDWIVPNTELKIRMGLQEIVLPGLEDGSQVFADDVAGIVMNYAFTENVGATLWWARPFSDNNSEFGDDGKRRRQFDELDMVGLSIPLTFDGVSVTPWAMYAAVGRDIFSDEFEGETSSNHFRQLLPRWADPEADGFRPSDGQASAWWAGLTGDVTAWDPFRLAWDFNYGSVDMGHSQLDGERYDMKRSGWYAALLAEYAFECVTPGLIFWYGSGDDSDWKDGSEMMPSIHAASPFTSFGQDGAEMNFFGTAFQSGLAGTWGLVARLNDISFIDDLSHTVQVAYYRGTNDKNMTAYNGGPIGDPWSSARNDSGDAYTYMTEKDSAWEVNVNTYYDIYKNLKAGLELGYIRMDLSDSAWGSSITNREESAWKVGLGLQYNF